MSNMNKKGQKIDCNVTDCSHNCVQDCTCRLEQIQVCPCNDKGEDTPENKTACSMYHYCGNLNAEESYNSKQL